MIHKLKQKDKNDEQNRKTKRKRQLTEEQEERRRKIKRISMIAVIVILLLIGFKIGLSAHVWRTLATDMLANKNSIVKDIDGNKIATLGEEKKKMTVDLNKIPTNLKNAYVSIEDERYYKHHGVDLKRTASATLSYIFHFGSSSYGGSTITQQLVKNLTGDSTDSVWRKVKEWWKAWNLEMIMDKDEILEEYLNVIYVGPNMYGVKTGAKYYFNKDVEDLSLAECAFLAGINNSPNSYNPFSDTDRSEKIKKRTRTVLGKMKELEYIDEENYQKAVEQVESGLNFKKGEIDKGNAVYSYHTDALIPEITNDIANKYDISKTFAENYIDMAGLTIYSTQNSKIQEQTETEFEKKKYSIASKKGGDSSQAAMIIMDHKTGNVLACAGGLGKKTESRPFNRATQGVRQTGSSSKPLAILVPGIKKRKFTASTIYDDTEQDFKNGYHPTDYSKALGKITVRRAVESSQNIPFVEMIEEIGPSTSIRYLKKMGITSLTDEDKALPLALGGLQKGISPLEMAGAYSTIANDGNYIEPTFYTKAEKKDGKVAVKTKQKKRHVFSKQVAYVIKEILKQPVEGTNGTATYCKISGVDVAAKTGTTDENYDRWLCGFTPYYTAVTWFGYDENETVEFNKRNPAGLIWANVMYKIHAGLKSAEFEKPAMINTITICAESGKEARTGCKHTYTENFLLFSTPGLCDIHGGDKKEANKDKGLDLNAIIPDIKKEIDSEEPQKGAAPIEEPETDNSGDENVKIKEQPTEDNTNKNTSINTNTSKENKTNTTSPEPKNTTKTNSTNTNSTQNKENATSPSSTRPTTNTSGREPDTTQEDVAGDEPETES